MSNAGREPKPYPYTIPPATCPSQATMKKLDAWHVQEFFRIELLLRSRIVNDDPIFPATSIAQGATRQFEAVGLKRAHWSSAARIRTIFRDAFVNAGLSYFNPHSFRTTLVRLGEVVCRTPEDFKAWSQNLGHEGVLTTFVSYGEVPDHRQGEIIHGLASPRHAMQSDYGEIARALVRVMRESGPQNYTGK